MSTNRGKTIANNIMLFTIGNFGSRVLMFLMVLVYTHYIEASDLGYYDLIISTISLASPLVLMAFTDGIYRWLIDANHADVTYIRSVISTCNKTVLGTSIASVAFFLALGIYFDIQYYLLIAFLLVSQVLFQINQEAVRGLSNNKLYAGIGLVNSSVCLILEMCGLVALNGGVSVLLYARIISNVLSIILLYFLQSELRKSIFVPFDKKLFREIAAFSLPLIPNLVSWWIVGSSDRYIVVGFLGTAANGIYSVANKFPTIVTVLTGIVHMALLEVIIKEYNAKDRDTFYSNLFEKYYYFLFSLIMCAIPATKIVIETFVSEEYTSAWLYTGFLYLSTVFSALSSFYGVGYTVTKDTKRSVKSTVLAAFANILINLLLIRVIGLHAASLSTFVSYLLLFVIRIFHSKKYFKIEVSWKKFAVLMMLSGVVLAVTYTCGSIINICLTSVCIIVFIIMNKSLIMSLVRKKQENK